MDIFGSILQSLQDVIKFEITDRVSTGDKKRDMVLIPFCFVIVSAVFTLIKTDFFAYLKYFINFVLNKNVIIDNVYRKFFIDNFVDTNNIRLSMLSIKSDEEYMKRLCSFLIKILPNKKPIIYDIKNKQTIGKNNIQDNFEFINESVLNLTKTLNNPIIPIYYNRKSFIYLYRENTENPFCIGYNDSKFYDSFNSMISELPVSNYETIITKEIPGENQIETFIFTRNERDSKNMKKYKFFPDRKMCDVITKHKPKIMSLINNFKKAEITKRSEFNGYGSYNLGFIFYGLPGTGKTLMMKAICNELKRSAYVVNMRNIRTRLEFEDIFLNEELIQKHVFVLDEFDCVQGVIKSRSNGEEQKSSLKELKDRYAQLLNTLSTATTNSDTTALKEEIAKVRTEMLEKENALTLDTMLTVLDGIIEIRGRVIIANTNHIEHIDSALLREGRFDAKIELGRFNHDEVKELIEKMLKGKITEEDKEYYENTKFREDMTPVQIINKITEIMNYEKPHSDNFRETIDYLTAH